MAEQELHKKLSKAAFEWTMSSDSKSIADVVMPICKAYAAAQVAAKDAEISELKVENQRLRDALIWLKQNRTPDRAMIEIFIDKSLSPAPVTECVGKLAYCIKWCESLQYDSNRIATIKHRMEVHSNGVPGDDWWIFIDGMPKFHIWRGDKCHFEYVYAIIGDIIKNSPKTEIKR